MTSHYVSARVYWSLYHKHKALEEENALLRRYITNGKTPSIAKISSNTPFIPEARFEENKEHGPINSKKTDNDRCQHIKKNGERCRQTGKPNQSGGEIIQGRCGYHR